MFASYIVGAARTPRGRGKRDKGALAGIHPQELFAQTLATLKERLGFEPRDVDDLIATLEGFRREDLDALALRSQQNAARAMRKCRFSKSLFPVRDPFTGQVVLDRDEFPRPDTTAEGLAALNPAFINLGQTVAGPNGETFDELALRVYPEAKVIRHMHTAGNSSGISDGAAGGALASQRFVQERRLSPRARIRAMVTVGSEPVIMLTAPALASEKALHLAGMKPHDIDLWEINEAFASVVLQTTRALKIDPDLVNLNGGAIALGHPLGATGAMLLGTGLDELERSGKHTALITMCIGGGQGIATIIERM